MSQREHNRLDRGLTAASVAQLRQEWKAWTGPKRRFAVQAGRRLGVHPVTIEYAIDGRTWT
jgi:hypothetical protein